MTPVEISIDKPPLVLGLTEMVDSNPGNETELDQKVTVLELWGISKQEAY